MLIRDARVVTLAGGPGPRRGDAGRDLGVIERADVRVVDGTIDAVGDGLDVPEDGSEIVADGAVVMPAFVDCHTHACWAGERLDEWERKLAGATYLELLEAGGGIMATVRAVRAASDEALEANVLENLRPAHRHGTATIEIKSGYGLTTRDELRMLQAITRAAARWAGTVVPTACIGHALDPGQTDQIQRTISETLPAVSETLPGVTIDAYCERGAWSLDDCLRLFEAAQALGHPVRVHADQFNDLGLIPEAVRRGFVSVDHLEASTPEHLDALAASDTFGVVLPCSGFHTDGRYADARRFVDAGGALALATNTNPGSSPCAAVPFAIAMGVRGCGLTPAEAITAATVNAAALLGFDDRGRIEPGCRADLILLDRRDERELAHSFGANPVVATIIAGQAV